MWSDFSAWNNEHKTAEMIVQETMLAVKCFILINK